MGTVRPSMRDVRRPTAVAIWVSDLERSAGFYRDVIGVPLEHSEPHEPENVEHYEAMWGDWDDRGPVEPYLWFNVVASDGRVTSGTQLSFPVPDVDAVLARAAGADVVFGPHDVPWGRSAELRDPDGNFVTVTE